MSTPDKAWWATAQAARARLEASIMQDANVRMISIGLDPERKSNLPVLIVHVRDSNALSSTIPTQLDGIPVRVVYGDFHVEQGEL
jgi:hypothetical protein